ncbi:Syntaxin-like protein psy1 [Schizosaccharomyces pombe 972h-] [Rhizoctonia solani]|uniref:Syntaxin-like protein psy1 [Schizosaccharomyces pombe 972h-] n=1 Tax=Rhizoctonia solani TaxID=456999 RepID=A0A0K6G9E6_9AGAM|nr:Syntaxin-like protein psy1 [Schizosaccharomyces pombe 972h-] [Rhizoctonia solani]
MARDRLAALRAQNGGDNGYTNMSDNSYPSQQYTNPYAQQDNGRYEMSAVNNSTTQLTAGDTSDMTSFYTEISSIQDQIRTYNDTVQRIADLHNRSLNQTDEAAAQRNASQLEQLQDDVSSLSSQLQRRIKDLMSKSLPGRDGQIRAQQTNLVNAKFVEAIQNYQVVERDYRSKSKQRVERQFKIVKPDATPEEVKAAVNDDSGNGQIFSQALMNSNRFGESRAAYREVQSRHEDLKKIEKTLTELAQLFNDMSVLVAQQDETIDTIEHHAMETHKDMEAGLQHTEAAVVSARGARKKRWICFGIIVAIIIIVVIIVLVVLAQNGAFRGSGSNNNSSQPQATASA